MPQTYRYEIDYEWGVGTLWSPVAEAEAAARFEALGGQCFGLRKSMGPVSVLSARPAPIPEPFGSIPGAYEMIEHNAPLSDTIVWDAEGNKVKSEWDDDPEVADA